MATRLRELGWNEVEVIDENLGRSAAGLMERTGFERMVAEVCMGQVGAVAAREVSRFASVQGMGIEVAPFSRPKSWGRTNEPFSGNMGPLSDYPPERRRRRAISEYYGNGISVFAGRARPRPRHR